MVKPCDISLIISTYNRPDALVACLESVRRQKRLPMEVIVADDGSGEETKSTIERLARDFPIPIIHVWQEDRGFRLAQIRNKAIARARGKYIVQTDGDIVMSRRFIADHARYAREGEFVKGVRVRLDETPSREICLSPRGRIPSFFSRGLLNRLKAVRFLPLAYFFASYFKKDKAYGLGCNMAFFKKDLIAVNGYDEAFEGWGREDDDIAHRLYRAGIKMRDLRFAGICYHLWHVENSRADMEENMRKCAQRDAAGIVRAEKGLDAHL